MSWMSPALRTVLKPPLDACSLGSSKNNGTNLRLPFLVQIQVHALVITIPFPPGPGPPCDDGHASREEALIRTGTSVAARPSSATSRPVRMNKESPAPGAEIEENGLGGDEALFEDLAW